MTDRKFSHYVVSVSGEKGLGPWLADDGDGCGPYTVTERSDAKVFKTRAAARDALGWCRLRFCACAKTMAVYVRAKAVTSLDVARATVEALEEAERLGVKLVLSLEGTSLSASWQVFGSANAKGRLVGLKPPVDCQRKRLDFIREISEWIRSELGVKP